MILMYYPKQVKMHIINLNPFVFRVINLSYCILKLLERLVLWHLHNDLEIEAAMNKSRYGFKKAAQRKQPFLNESIK